MIIPTMMVFRSLCDVLNSNMDQNGYVNMENKPIVPQGTNFINVLSVFCPKILYSDPDVKEGDLSFEAVKLLSNIYEIYSKFHDDLEMAFNDFISVLESYFIKDNVDQLGLKHDLGVTKEEIDSLSALKSLSMDLQRAKPTEWNSLLDIV